MSASDRWKERVAAGEQRANERKVIVDNSGGGGDNGGMDTRIANLEADVKDIKKDLVDLKVSVAAVSAKVDIIVSKMPSWWQAPVSAGGLIALVASLIGIAKALSWL